MFGKEKAKFEVIQMLLTVADWDKNKIIRGIEADEPESVAEIRRQLRRLGVLSNGRPTK